MSRNLYRLLSKLNFTTKDRTEFIKELYKLQSPQVTEEVINGDPELIGVIVRLELGDSQHIIDKNKELLVKANLQVGPHFNVNIDYGFGTADYIPQMNDEDVAGHASIITNHGHFKKYDILNNGKLIETSPDIDIVELYNKINNI